MKTKLSIIVVFILVSFMNNLYSQDTCKVLKPEIVGKYVGKCKKGLAHGRGVAQGVDKYEGRFKNGLPDGEGKYTYSNGVIYQGGWEKGKRNGKGQLFFNVSGIDSIRNGYWKDDKFVRKIDPNPYIVSRTSNLTRYSVTRIGDGEKVLFSFKQSGTENTGISNFNLYSSSGTWFSLGPNPGYEKITFPVTFRVSYNSLNKLRTSYMFVEFEVQIREPGNWEIELDN